MKSFKRIDETLYGIDDIHADFIAVGKGKRKRGLRARYRAEPENHQAALIRRLHENTFTYEHHVTAIINENSYRKQRLIQKPYFFYEQPAHHALVRAAMPVYMRGMMPYACASIPGRGQWYGKKRIEAFIRIHPEKCKYVLKFDIKHFFQSIPHRRLKKALKRKIKDRVFLKKLFAVIDSCPEGLPIGYYTSQWFGNFYLTAMDHYLKEVLRADFMMRYMDDVIIFCPNKKRLHRILEGVRKYLWHELGLIIKGDWQIFRFSYTDRSGVERGRFVDFMGFRFYRNRTTLRRATVYRTRRQVNRIKRKGRCTITQARSLLSRLGWFKGTNTRGFFTRYIKPYIKVKTLRHKVSRWQRRENDRLGNSSGLSGRSARRDRSSFVPEYGLSAS